MIRINLLAVCMVVLGAGSAHLLGPVALHGDKAGTALLAGALLILMDGIWRARVTDAPARKRWLSGETGGVISIFPVWGIGVFGLLYEGLTLFGYKL